MGMEITEDIDVLVEVRVTAINALAAGWADDPETARFLRERAEADWHGSVQVAAVKALAAGWLSHPETEQFLRELAKNGTGTRYWAGHAAREALSTIR